jgi:hypothetical protein
MAAQNRNLVTLQRGVKHSGEIYYYFISTTYAPHTLLPEGICWCSLPLPAAGSGAIA